MIGSRSLRELFLKPSVDKQMTLTFSSGDVLTNKDVFYESQEITESLCSEQELKFGACEASCYKITIANNGKRYKGQLVEVSLNIEGNDFNYGKYRIVSDTPTANRANREIVAYDQMYDIIHYDSVAVAKWYNETLFKTSDTVVTLKVFRDSFFKFIGVEQESVNLPNDAVKVKKGLTVSTLSGKEVITAICELNGCFGHIGRDGLFHYVFLKKISTDEKSKFYPSLALYPSSYSIPNDYNFGIENGNVLIEKYSSCTYEEYDVKKIGRIEIRSNADWSADTTFDNSNENTYVVSENFLTYDLDSDTLSEIMKNMYEAIKDITYIPFTASTTGNPCIEVGDSIRIKTSGKTIDSYILNRTIRGIQNLMDDYESKGTEEYAYDSSEYTTMVKETKANIRNADGKSSEAISVLEKWSYDGDKVHIDGGNIYARTIVGDSIDANTITAINIASESITADKLLIGNSQNYATADPLLNVVYPSKKMCAGCMVDSEYLVKRSITTGGFRVSSIIPNPFKEGDELIYTINCRADTATGTMSVKLFATDSSDGSRSYDSTKDKNITSSFSVTNSNKTYTGTLSVTKAIADLPYVYFYVGDGRNTKSQIYVKEISILNRVTSTLIKDGAITTNKIEAEAITADKIAASSITANKLKIGDYANLATANEKTGSVYPNTTTARGCKVYSGHLAKIDDTNAGFRVSEFIPNRFKKGDTIYYELVGKVDTSTGRVLCAIMGADDATGANAWHDYVVGECNMTSAYARFKGVLTITKEMAACKYIFFYIWDRRSTLSALYCRDITIYKQTGSTLIQDGAITTDKIEAKAIKAGQIDTDAVTADKIKAGAVKADKIDVDNLFAQNINATGTIKGATIKSASGEFTKSFLVNIEKDSLYYKLGINNKKFELVTEDEDCTSRILCDPSYVELSYNLMSMGGRSTSIQLMDSKIEINGYTEFTSLNPVAIPNSDLNVGGTISSVGNIETDSKITSKNGFYSKYGRISDYKSEVCQGVNVPTSTPTSIAHFTLNPGRFLIIADVRFPANANGQRIACVNATENSASAQFKVEAASLGITQFSHVRYIYITEQKEIYLSVQQNSGSTLTLDENCKMTAIRLF